MARFEARREPRLEGHHRGVVTSGWRVVDTVTGHLHSARIPDRARAEAQAATMNRKLEQIRRGFERGAVARAEDEAYREDARRRTDAAAAADPFYGLCPPMS